MKLNVVNAISGRNHPFCQFVVVEVISVSTVNPDPPSPAFNI